MFSALVDAYLDRFIVIANIAPNDGLKLKLFEKAPLNAKYFTLTSLATSKTANKVKPIEIVKEFANPETLE